MSYTFDVPTFIRRMPPCGTKLAWIREFTARVLNGTLVWR